MNLDRPDDYSDAEWQAYLDGVAHAFEMSAEMYEDFLDDIDESSDPQPTLDQPDADDDDRCGECGMELRQEMGRGGRFCPVCDV